VNFDIAHMLQRKGFNVFTFYYRGSWGSGGKFSWSNLIDDSLNAYDFLRSESAREKFKTNANKIIFLGYSFGGFSALLNSAVLDEIKNVCAIAPFNAGMNGQFMELNPGIREYGAQKIQTSLDFLNGTGTDELVNEMIKHKQDWNLVNYAEKLSKKNLLFIGAQFDSTSPLEVNHNPLVTALKAAGAQNLKEVVLECGHSFSNKRIQLMKLISEWVNELKF